MLFRDGLQIIQGVIRVGADASNNASVNSSVEHFDAYNVNGGANAITSANPSVNGDAIDANSHAQTNGHTNGNGDTIADVKVTQDAKILAGTHRHGDSPAIVVDAGDGEDKAAVIEAIRDPAHAAIVAAAQQGQDAVDTSRLAAPAVTTDLAIETIVPGRPRAATFATQPELAPIARDEGVCEEMVRWAERLPLETLVLVEGRVMSPVEDSHGEQRHVRSGNVHGAEIEVFRVRRSFHLYLSLSCFMVFWPFTSFYARLLFFRFFSPHSFSVSIPVHAALPLPILFRACSSIMRVHHCGVYSPFSVLRRRVVTENKESCARVSCLHAPSKPLFLLRGASNFFHLLASSEARNLHCDSADAV